MVVLFFKQISQALDDKETSINKQLEELTLMKSFVTAISNPGPLSYSL